MSESYNAISQPDEYKAWEDGYQQGIVDERKEWEHAVATLLIKYADDIHEALPDVVKDIQNKARADAIEEFLKKDKECQQKHDECPYINSDIGCVECIANQLKE